MFKSRIALLHTHAYDLALLYYTFSRLTENLRNDFPFLYRERICERK